MSATERSPSPPPGTREDQPSPTVAQNPIAPADLPPTQHDPSKEDSQQTEMNTAEDTASHTQHEAANTKAESTEASQQPPAGPSHPDMVAGQMETLSVSGKDTSDARPSSSMNTPPPPPPPAKDETYINPTATPAAPTSQPGGEPSAAPSSDKELPNVPGDSDPESRQGGQDDGTRDENDSQPEIQSIMGQFQDPSRTTDQQEIMSPRLELAEQFRGGPHSFPPRRSSLESKQPMYPIASTGAPSGGQPAPPAPQHPQKPTSPEAPMLTRQSSSSTVPPPPDTEPDQPFDFHRFLEQLRHRTADPVAKFLRSFLMEFGKRQWMVHEQVKIISDFLVFITNKMAMCEVWRDVSDSEFDNAKEGMEKLVMNRLYSQTFAPAIPAPPSIPRSASRSRRRELERLHGPWRRGQHQEDIERDDILAQKMRIYSWVSEEHLDISPVSGGGRRFLNLAQQGMSGFLLSLRSKSNPASRIVED